MNELGSIGYLTFAVVTDIDRQWAIEQRPAWLPSPQSTDAGEIVDNGEWLDCETKSVERVPDWPAFVHDEAEKFERYFPGQKKTYGDWSRLWRLSWWPEIRPHIRFPDQARKIYQPFFRAGTPEFAAALGVATPAERALWERFGVAQFRPEDERCKKIVSNAKRVLT